MIFIHIKQWIQISHGEKGSVLAKEILNDLGITTNDETELICNAIYNHSNGENKYSEFTEVLIDANVLQHYLYNVTLSKMDKENERLIKIINEFGIRKET
jgi:uncharacterized protein